MPDPQPIDETSQAARYVVLMGLAAMEIAMKGKSKKHDVETVVAWLRHAAQHANASTPNPPPPVISPNPILKGGMVTAAMMEQ